MRITNQMLSASARKAGIPLEGNSLLDYLNKDDGGNLLDSLNGSNNLNQSVSSVYKNNYDKIQKAAEAYEKQAKSLAESGEGSIWAKANETGDLSAVYDNIKSLVDKYNSTLEAVRKTPDSLNTYYMQMFTQGAADRKEVLEAAGVTVQKDGTLKLDEDKMKAADLKALEKAFGSGSYFLARTGFVAARAADHAKTSAESVTSQYTAKGSLITAETSRYDFLG